MNKKEFERHPLYWKNEDTWYVHRGWMSYFWQSHGLPPEMFLEIIGEYIRKYG